MLSATELISIPPPEIGRPTVSKQLVVGQGRVHSATEQEVRAARQGEVARILERPDFTVWLGSAIIRVEIRSCDGPTASGQVLSLLEVDRIQRNASPAPSPCCSPESSLPDRFQGWMRAFGPPRFWPGRRPVRSPTKTGLGTPFLVKASCL
jgi:hypothetical protein